MKKLFVSSLMCCAFMMTLPAIAQDNKKDKKDQKKDQKTCSTDSCKKDTSKKIGKK